MGQRRDLIPRKGGGWAFNKRWPKDVELIAPGSHFRKGLGTSDLSVAIRRRTSAEDEFWAKVDGFRRRLDDHPRQLSETEASTIVSRWFRERNDELDAGHLSEPVPDEVREAELRDLPHNLALLDDALARNDTAPIASLARRIFAEQEITILPEGPGYQYLLQLLFRANKELALIDAARLKGDFGYRPSDPVFAAAMENDNKGRPKRTLGDLIEAHWAAKSPDWSPRTQEQFPPVHRLLRDSLGATRALDSIGIEDAEQLELLVKSLPANLSRRSELKSLSVPKAVQKGKALGLPKLAAKTINDTYISGVKTIFSWAERKGWIDRSPMRVIEALRDPIPASRKRDAFTIEQIQTLFSLAPWGGPSAGRNHYPARYWTPLLALYHGFRLAEVCGLMTNDVARREGHPVIIVRVNNSRTLKTEQSERTMPVHPELVRLGFLEYVEGQQKAGQDRLFPDARAKNRGQMGYNVGAWFSQLVKGLGLEGRNLTFHALRHTFKDRLREADISGDLGNALTGHAKGGVSASYGSGFSTGRLREAIERIEYPGLNLDTTS